MELRKMPMMGCPQNDDEVNGQEKNDIHLEAPRQKRTINSNNAFVKRIEDLNLFKAKHGHVRVTAKQDKSLGWFCTRRSMRCAMSQTTSAS